MKKSLRRVETTARYVRATTCRRTPKPQKNCTTPLSCGIKIGYRDHVVTNEEIACTGCKEENWCRYRLVKCVNEKHIAHCGQCENYPCDVMKACFTVTGSFISTCKKVCTPEDFEILRKAFFEKEKNLTQN